MYCYKVKHWCGSETIIETGIVAAHSASEAMEYLSDRFGADDIEQLKLAVIDSESVDEHILPFNDFDCNWNTFIKDEIF